MADYSQVLLCLLVITISTDLSSSTSESTQKPEEKDDLVGTETRDGKLEIIKKIKKINNDGSYTIGYEADDGSFKIESRDVLGQIKGTYGFVDENGQIKRVSYTSSNSSETISTQESPTVVQRIPSRNRTTTNRPTYFSSSFPSTSSITTTPGSSIQSIARRRTTSTTTTSRPSSSGNQYEKTTVSKPNYVTYTSAPPRVLLQGRPSQASQVATKSEGQIIRPDIVTIRPKDAQLSNVLHLKHLNVEKPVHEETEPEVRSNILRRQLLPQNSNLNYDVRDQLQQSLGHDSSDIYTHSMSTSHPKPPLFTTTLRPRPVVISSTTPYPVSVVKPVVPYPEHYQSRSPQDIYQAQQSYSQETTTTRPHQHHSTSTTVPVVQIPANKPDESGHSVPAFRHPLQADTILIPLRQVQGKLVPIDQFQSPNDDQGQYFYQGSPQNTRVIEIEQQKAVVRRLPPSSLRPIPVKVDDNGHIKDVPQQVSIPYPYPVHVNAPIHSEPINNVNLEATTKYVETEIGNDIDHIQPPVSTKDFQRLLEQLIIRQSRLEKVSMLTRHPEVIVHQLVRARPSYPQQAPFFYKKSNIPEHDTPIAYIQNPQGQPQSILNIGGRPKQNIRFQPQDLYIDPYDNQAYRPMRRIARLQPSVGAQQQLLDEEHKTEYLPPNVREMLLLRMLQLAINPALPIDENDIEIDQMTVTKKPVRNVEILGEEVDVSRARSDRIKRYQEEKYH